MHATCHVCETYVATMCNYVWHSGDSKNTVSSARLATPMINDRPSPNNFLRVNGSPRTGRGKSDISFAREANFSKRKRADSLLRVRPRDVVARRSVWRWERKREKEGGKKKEIEGRKTRKLRASSLLRRVPCYSFRLKLFAQPPNWSASETGTVAAAAVAAAAVVAVCELHRVRRAFIYITHRRNVDNREIDITGSPRAV